jgi:aspartate/methionine/tyrosine aminotransferase
MPRLSIREIMDLARQVPNTVHFQMGEPGFSNPSHIVQAPERAMEQGFTKYTADAV